MIKVNDKNQCCNCGAFLGDKVDGKIDYCECCGEGIWCSND